MKKSASYTLTFVMLLALLAVAGVKKRAGKINCCNNSHQTEIKNIDASDLLVNRFMLINF